MLKIIDRYIIRKFLTTFFFMLGVIMLLAVVFDVSDKLSTFIQHNASLKEIIFDYYLNFILLYANMFSAMFIFVSVIWFTSKMAQDTEIIPIWNSGRSFGRFVRPYMVGATILMLLALIVNHVVLPPANKTRLEFEEKYYWDNNFTEDYFAEYPGNEIVYFSSYSSQSDNINKLRIEKWNDKGEIESLIIAENATCKPGSNKWTLNQYFERHFGDTNDVFIEGLKKDTVFKFSIDEMAIRDNVAESMNFFELKDFIERERKKGSKRVPAYEIVLYERTALPFSAYVLTIIGISVASRKKRGGIGINIAIGLGIIFIYIFAMKVMSVASLNVGFPAIIAAWVPNIVFGTIAYLLYKRVQR